MTAILTDPARTAPGSGDTDTVHLYCCDEDVAMCGEDLTDEPIEDGAPDERLCPLCGLVDENGWACPVPGCTGGDAP